jgi:outer membrane lipoprotein-sorting protein
MKPPTGSHGHRLVVLASLLASLLVARSVPGQETAPAPSAPKPQNEARALLDQAHQLDDTTRAWHDRTQRLKLHIVDGRGIERNRELTMKTAKHEGGEDKTITVFHIPPEVRGTSFLQFAHRDRDAEQWLFLPALNRVRQISAQSKNESFMGTDFSYRDLELLSDVIEWTEDEAPARLVGNETIDGAEVALIELVPKKKDVGYQRIRLAMEKPKLVIRRMEFYGAGDAPKKLLRLDDFRDVSGIPTAFSLHMAQPQLNSRTDVEIVDVRYNQGLSDDEFTQRALERGAMDAD